jgi:cell division septation protein DedD
LRGLCLAILAALIACSSPEADWKKADAQGTIAAYQKYLTDHPKDSRADQARARIQALQDDQAWADAQKANTAAAYKQYVDTQPNGIHAADAQERMTSLQRADAWKTAQTDGKAPAIQAFLQTYPQGPEADQARAELQKLTAYRVQLGAFRSKKEAVALSTRVKAKYGDLLHDVVVVAPSGSDKVNRVRSAGMTEEEAKSACAKLKKAHQHCEVIKA